MKDKYQLFYNWVVNQGIEVSDKTNAYQCFDLAYAWILFLNFPKQTIQHLYAYEIFTKPTATTKDHFELITNSPLGVPQAGDLVVFDKTSSNIAGHVSVATGDGDTKTFTSLDQNWNGRSSATLVVHNYDIVLGWLRPKLETHTLITDQTKIPQISNKEVQQIKSELLDGLKRIDTLTESNIAFRNDLVASQNALGTAQEKIELLKGNLKTLEEKLSAPVGTFNNPIAKALYQIAVRLG